MTRLNQITFENKENLLKAIDKALSKEKVTRTFKKDNKEIEYTFIENGNIYFGDFYLKLNLYNNKVYVSINYYSFDDKMDILNKEKNKNKESNNI